MTAPNPTPADVEALVNEAKRLYNLDTPKCRYGDNGHACCEDGLCAAEVECERRQKEFEVALDRLASIARQAQGQDAAAVGARSHAAEDRDALAAMEARKDAAYEERNRVVAALAKCFPSGTARTAIEGWSEDWHGCVYIDLPTGQASWHYHDSQAHLFEGLPAYTKPWDGHSTEEKYRRLAALVSPPADVQRDAERLEWLIGHAPAQMQDVKWLIECELLPGGKEYASVRAAIDAAMSAASQESGGDK